jgi:hypothetical protein
MEDLRINERIILNLICKKLDGAMGWNGLAQCRAKWLALVNAVMNLRVS